MTGGPPEAGSRKTTAMATNLYVYSLCPLKRLETDDNRHPIPTRLLSPSAAPDYPDSG